MIKQFIDFSGRNPILIILLTLACIILSVQAIKHIKLDAIPDLSDTQVIIFSRWDRSPDILEDQVTYPIITALLGAPKVKTIRGFSDFGYSYVYVIFEDGTDIYWARSRVLEYISKIQSQLPSGVKTELGPDATSLGWIFQYAIVDKTNTHNLAELRTLQDWYLRYWLQAVPGVSEVASIGGSQKQYQVQLDPIKLYAYKIPITKVTEAIKKSNNEVGARMIEFSGIEYMIRAKGYIKSKKDIEDIVVSSDENGTPILIKDLGLVTLGPDLKRGVSDLNGQGDVVGGIVIMRHGENALNVINRVKEKIENIKPSLPEGVELMTVYDRSTLIKEAIGTLIDELIYALIIVSLTILVFLFHMPSAIVPIITIPVSVLLAFIPMKQIDVTANIMSLGGIAISIGVLVDGAIIEVENAYKRIEHWLHGDRKEDFHDVRLNALKEVGPTVFFSLLVIAVSFLPIFALEGQEGRLFKPLAYTKTLTIAMAAILAVTLDPAIRMLFARIEPFTFRPNFLAHIANHIFIGKYYVEEKHPISSILHRIYEPACRFVLKHAKLTIISAVIISTLSIPLYLKLGSEFMPDLWEGDILYMPTTLPGISVTEAQTLLTKMDEVIKTVPEVISVFGKAGRADTSTDPAPFSMIESTIHLKPRSEWRTKERFYSSFPKILQAPLRFIFPDNITKSELTELLNEKMKFIGTSNAWTMPIKARIDMLSTGIRTPIGIKISGSDIKVIEDLASKVESLISPILNTRSVYAERAASGYYLDFNLKRTELARFGISIEDAQMAIMSAIGGEEVTKTIEGKERYSVNIRYFRELKDSIPELSKVLISNTNGEQIPISTVADLHIVQAPSMIRNENGSLTGYVYVDISTSDIGGYVENAKKIISENLKLPAGYSIEWSGQYENMLRVKESLKLLVPLTLLLVFFILYFNTKSWVETCIVMLAVPFSAVGAIGLLYLLNYNISIATWVGIIALLGLDAETGVFMLMYLDQEYRRAKQENKLNNYNELSEAIIHGAVKRLRPKLMTICAAILGLLPLMFAQSAGADVMRQVAAPLIGGLITSFILELLVYPAIYGTWKWNFELKNVHF